MEFSVAVVEGCQVRAIVAPNLTILQDALDDSIGTRPPRGAPQDGPSTYWIDKTLRGLRARISESSAEPFAEGNITYLRLVGDEVVAGYDYAPEQEGDQVKAEDLLKLLSSWREATIALDAASEERLPPPRQAIPL